MSIEKKEEACLFSQAQVQEIEQKYQEWFNNTLRDADRKTEKNYTTHSGIPIKPLHTPADIKDLDYIGDIGFPGQPPFLRGIYPNMYRGRAFTVRQLAGLGAPEDCNIRIKYLLDHGATGANILFDLPTIRGYDSTDPEAEGNVGACGAAVDSIWDIDAYFADIDLETISTSIVTHLPSTSIVIPGMYFAIAERRGTPWANLAGTCQNDFIMETCVGSAPEMLWPRTSFRLQCDVVEWICKHIPRWNPISFNGYNLREAGTDAVGEVAIAMANAIATADELIRRGMHIDDFAPRMSFFWDLHNDFFEEIAKCRASRKVWYKIIKDRYGAKNQKSLLMRFHVQTAGVTLPATEPLNNIARSAIQGLAAVLGGCQSLHTDSYDEAYSAPTEEAALISLRTQQIIQAETGVCNTVDPLAGSYYVEHLTEEMARRILTYLEKIEDMGGLVEAVESGWLHREISKYNTTYQKKIETGEMPIVGLNYMRAEEDRSRDIEVFEYPETYTRQKAKMERLKKERSQQKVKDCLDILRQKCHTDENLYPYTLEAVKNLCSLGEIEEIFREEFGLWSFPLL
ncbi:MAG: methylmalonyl-CoA mutase family protein [Desulfobacterales bacterium]|jgi:methylmalonyl-CoA mutase N-terminal domain/subunit